jgi:hypothetical protein
MLHYALFLVAGVAAGTAIAVLIIIILKTID